MKTLFSFLGFYINKNAGVYLVYVGTYTGGDSEGIYAFTFDSNTGELKPHGEVTKTVNPSFVDVHPNGKYLYAVNETVEYKGEKAGYITSFSIDQESGALTELNQQSNILLNVRKIMQDLKITRS